jgi:hypothetical protein
MKGILKPDHIPTNKYEFIALGLPPFTPVTMSGIEDELNTADLPDRTVGSGGVRNATEIVVGIPMHHKGEMAAMELWYEESQDPVTPTYKKECLAIYKSISDNRITTYALSGVFPNKRKLPDAELESEGDMAVVEWTFKVDDIKPLT